MEFSYSNLDQFNLPTIEQLRRFDSVINDLLTPQNRFIKEDCWCDQESWVLTLGDRQKFDRDDGLSQQSDILVFSDESIELENCGLKLYILATNRVLPEKQIYTTDVYIFSNKNADNHGEVIYMSSVDALLFLYDFKKEKDNLGFILTFFEIYQIQKCDEYEVQRLVDIFENAALIQT